jgi:DNA adenine methylase
MRTRPFLKWPGNKYRVLGKLAPVLPRRRILIEPFLGSGAVFMNIEAEEYRLSDSNSDLIRLYQDLKQEGSDFIGYARSFFIPANNHSEVYYRYRDRFNTLQLGPEKSALFIYLNRHGYNGLCRYNASGQYNVPFGSHRRIYFPEEKMQQFYHKSQRALFYCEDYTQALMRILEVDVQERRETLVYCDPPYVPLSTSASFTKYTVADFTMVDQEALAEWASRLSEAGVLTVISNHDTPVTRQLYRDATVYAFQVLRQISCRAEARGAVGELLARFEPRL